MYPEEVCDIRLDLKYFPFNLNFSILVKKVAEKKSRIFLFQNFSWQ